MQVHSQVMLVCEFGQSQLTLAKIGVDCRSGCFRLQVVTLSPKAQQSQNCFTLPKTASFLDRVISIGCHTAPRIVEHA